MKILYTRVSTLDQKTDRQKVSESDFDFVVEDKCSGSIPFFERPGGKEILNYLNKGILKELGVLQIDRLGRDLRDILNTIHFFSSKKVCIEFIGQGLKTIGPDGKENPISHMVIAILGIIGQMERTQSKERQLEGIRIAKMKGAYLGRKQGSNESVLNFLEKDKNRKALEYIRKGYKLGEVAKLTDLHINTITKIKKLGLAN